MCLNLHQRKQYPEMGKSQRGSALVIAVFVIVVMLAVVLSLSRLLLSSSESLVYEVQGSRAFFAAQSGLELALTRVFPLSGAPNCSALSLVFNDEGLPGCRVEVSCQALSLPVGNVATVLYQLNSIGVCTADNFVTSRELVLEVRQ